jgi:hypothetical protein
VASIPACHAGDQGSIPCVGVLFYRFERHLLKRTNVDDEQAKKLLNYD